MLRKHALSLIAPQKGAIALIVVLTLAPSLLGAIDPLVLKWVFDAVEARNYQWALFSLVLVFAAEIGRNAIGAFASVKSWDVRLDVDVSLRDRMVHKLTSISSDYHHVEGVGATMNRMAQCVSSFTNTLLELVQSLLPSIGYLVIAVAAMWKMNWQLALVVLGFAPLGPLIGVWASHEQVQRERTLLSWWNRVYSRLNEVLAGLRSVKSFAMEQTERERFIAAQKEGNAVVARGVRTDALTGWARGLTVSLARIGVLAFGTALIFKGQLTLGALVAFLGYVGGMLGPVQALTGLYQTVKKGVVAMDMMVELLEAPDEVPDREGAAELKRAHGDVTFEGVTFAHPKGPRVLDRFSLHVKQGESVALVGPSGSGKTTITNLLLRLHSLESGVISIDGTDIYSVTAQSLRRNIAYVSQDIHLFNDTVRSNIAYARADATDAEVEEAARAAHAHEFIVTLPNGYDTVVGERGGRLSGGQRQRLAIARALLKNASILVMDEATSALDRLSEAMVQDSLERLYKGRTTIFAAHRLSTVVNADRIVVLKGGRIVATGTHPELLRTCPFYLELVGASTEGLREVGRLAPASAST